MYATVVVTIQCINKMYTCVKVYMFDVNVLVSLVHHFFLHGIMIAHILICMYHFNCIAWGKSNDIL